MFDILGQFIRGASSQVQDPFFAGMIRWFGRLQETAFTRWRQVAASGIRCSGKAHFARVGLISCPNPAVSACLLCGKPTCVDHALVSSSGKIACLECMNEILKSRGDTNNWNESPHPHNPPPQPPAEDIAAQKERHLKVLGLKPGATSEEINARFRDISKKYHPDRVKDPAKKVLAEKKYKLITESFQWLKDKGN